MAGVCRPAPDLSTGGCVVELLCPNARDSVSKKRNTTANEVVFTRRLVANLSFRQLGSEHSGARVQGTERCEQTELDPQGRQGRWSFGEMVQTSRWSDACCEGGEVRRAGRNQEFYELKDSRRRSAGQAAAMTDCTASIIARHWRLRRRGFVASAKVRERRASQCICLHTRQSCRDCQQ
jgi:hypothetical protein